MDIKGINIKKIIKDCIPIIIFLGIMGIVTLILWPHVKTLGTAEGREAFKVWIDGLGFGGWLITLGIHLLQIFVAFIPGEPIEIMLGYVWGPWLGTFTCLFGIFIGTLTVFLLVRKQGMKLVKKVVGTDDLKKYNFLSDHNKVDLAVFILFFIPGTPKDILTYIVPIAPISPIKYLLIATFARIPSVITSTILGDRLAEGDYLMAVIVFVVTAVISVIGILVGNKYINSKQKKEDKSEENSTSATMS